MTQLPFELMYGVDVAVKKLRPGAQFELQGTNFTQWFDPTGALPPTWGDIHDQLEADRKVAEEWLAVNGEPVVQQVAVRPPEAPEPIPEEPIPLHAAGGPPNFIDPN